MWRPVPPTVGPGPGEKKIIFGPSSEGGQAKNLYTKSEGLTLSCIVKWAWSERVNLYTRQIMTLPWNTKTYAHGWAPVICTSFPPPSHPQCWPPCSLCHTIRCNISEDNNLPRNNNWHMHIGTVNWFVFSNVTRLLKRLHTLELDKNNGGKDVSVPAIKQ